jgi:hypothetical protein
LTFFNTGKPFHHVFFVSVGERKAVNFSAKVLEVLLVRRGRSRAGVDGSTVGRSVGSRWGPFYTRDVTEGRRVDTVNFEEFTSKVLKSLDLFVADVSLKSLNFLTERSKTFE